MIRVTRMSGKYYGINISSVRSDEDNIETFTDEGTPCILVNSLEDLTELDIEPSEVEMVD